MPTDLPQLPGAPVGFSQFPDSDAQQLWDVPLSTLRPALATPLPPPGHPLSVAFVGQRTFFRLTSQVAASAVIAPTFVDFREGEDPAGLRNRLAALGPHVVVVFRPELVPPALLSDLESLVVGYLTEPLPRGAGATHPDLERRLHLLARIDGGQFDRIISFDPEVADVVERFVPLWRSCPLPVDDSVYGWRAMAARPRPVFVGRSTAHREEFLLPAKHELDLLHIDHGILGDELVELLHHRCDVAVNLHNEDYPTFENRVSMHLAAGNLLISEPLSPAHGLEAGLDYLEIRHPSHLVGSLRRIVADPRAYESTRIRGRQKAEHFRASRVWARLIHDLLLDVATFGGRRSPG